MAGATEAQKKQMDAAESQVRQLLDVALSKQTEIEEAWFPSDAEVQVAGAIRQQHSTFNEWSGIWRTWAERGYATNGDAYPVEFWLRIGGDLASAFAQFVKGAYDASLFAVVENTTKATAGDATRLAVSAVSGAAQLAGDALKGALPELPAVSWKVKAGAVVLGVGAVALGGAYVVRSFK